MLALEQKLAKQLPLSAQLVLVKSTLVNLIPRFYDVSAGEILVDGVNVQDYGLEDLRNKVGYIPQKLCSFLEMSRAI